MNPKGDKNMSEKLKYLCCFYYFLMTYLFDQTDIDSTQKEILWKDLNQIFLMDDTQEMDQLFQKCENNFISSLDTLMKIDRIFSVIEIKKMNDEAFIEDEKTLELLNVKANALKAAEKMNLKQDKTQLDFQLFVGATKVNCHAMFIYALLFIKGKIVNQDIEKAQSLIQKLSCWPFLPGIFLSLFYDKRYHQSKNIQNYLANLYTFCKDLDLEHVQLYQIAKQYYDANFENQENASMKLLHQGILNGILDAVEYHDLAQEVVFSSLFNESVKKKILFACQRNEDILNRLPLTYLGYHPNKSLNDVKAFQTYFVHRDQEYQTLMKRLQKENTLVVYNSDLFLEQNYLKSIEKDIHQCNLIYLDVSKINFDDQSRDIGHIFIEQLQNHCNNFIVIRLMPIKNNRYNHSLLKVIEDRDKFRLSLQSVGTMNINLSQVKVMITCDEKIENDLTKYQFSLFSMALNPISDEEKEDIIHRFLEAFAKKRNIKANVELEAFHFLKTLPAIKMVDVLQEAIRKCIFEDDKDVHEYQISLIHVQEIYQKMEGHLVNSNFGF